MVEGKRVHLKKSSVDIVFVEVYTICLTDDHNAVMISASGLVLFIANDLLNINALLAHLLPTQPVNMGTPDYHNYLELGSNAGGHW